MKKILFLFAVISLVSIGSLSTASACPGMKGKCPCAETMKKQPCEKCKEAGKPCAKCKEGAKKPCEMDMKKKQPCTKCMGKAAKPRMGNPTGIFFNE